MSVSESEFDAFLSEKFSPNGKRRGGCKTISSKCCFVQHKDATVHKEFIQLINLTCLDEDGVLVVPTKEQVLYSSIVCVQGVRVYVHVQTCLAMVRMLSACQLCRNKESELCAGADPGFRSGGGGGGGISARAWQDTPTTSKAVWGSAVSSPIGVWGSAPAALQILHF